MRLHRNSLNDLGAKVLKFLIADKDRRVLKHYLSKAFLSTSPPPLLVLLFMLDPVACFPIGNYVSYAEFVGLHRQTISPMPRPLPTQDNTNAEEAPTYIHASSGIQTRHPSV
jgi:hypothetical protein